MRKITICLAFLLGMLFFSCGKDTPQPDKPSQPDPTKPVVVSAIEVDNKEVKMKPGQKMTLSYTVLPTNASDKEVEITSSKTDIVSVSGKEATAIKVGKTTITITSKSTSVSAKIEVEVIPIDAAELKLNKSEISLLVGDKETLVASIIPEDASEKDLTWKSGDEKVAKVSATGEVEAVGPGETEINVSTKDGKLSATAKVMVTAKTVAVESVTLQPTDLSLSVGSSGTVTATVLPANATDKMLEWKSSAATIASVDSKGVVKALKVGTTVITASTPDGKISAKMNVVVNPVPVTSIVLEPRNIIMAIQSSQTISATVLPSNASDKSLKWSSNAADIVSVDSQGAIKALKAGTAVITASTKDGKIQNAVNVQVKDDVSFLKGKLAFSLVANQFVTIGMQVYMTNQSNSAITIKKVEAYSDGALAATALSEFTQTIPAQTSEQWVIGFSQTRFSQFVGNFPPNWHAKIYFTMNGHNYAMTITNSDSSVQPIRQSTIGINPEWDGENTTEIPSK